MLLTHARRAGRVNAHGGLVPMREQDRGLWDSGAIAEGVALVTAALRRGHPGPYQLQAAIAALHDEAPSEGETDWPQIEALYGRLFNLTDDNPVVRLNHVVAVAMACGPHAGLALLDALEGDRWLATDHRLSAVRGHLLERTGDLEGAHAAYDRAAGLTHSLQQQRYLNAQAARLAR
jgi:predicted RNA polymerase sigma factor